MKAAFNSRPYCPACGRGETKTLFSRPYADPTLRSALEKFYAEVGKLDYDALIGAEYVLQECPACGLVFQRDVPSDTLLAQLYEEWISPPKAFARFHARILPQRHFEIARDVFLSLSLIASPIAPRRTLDYGCGWGEWGRMTQAFGAETWGTELSASRRLACQRTGIKIVDDTDLPDAGFDLINADQVFEHLPDPSATLALLAPKLRPGGVLRIAVPNGWRIQSKIARFDFELQRPRLGGLNPVAPLEHLNCFTTASLLRMAQRHGLVRRVPPWSILLRSAGWPPGWRAKVKQCAWPAYLRSGYSTQLWFTRQSRPAESPALGTAPKEVA